MSKSIQEILEKKYAGIRGRVLMLGLLFIFNAMIAIGASMHYTFGKTIVVMIIGLLGTMVSIGILSTPAKYQKTEIIENQVNEVA